MSTDDRRTQEGGIQDFETVRRLFTEGGPVLKHDCPLTYDLHATNPCFDGKRRYSEVEIKVHYIDDYDNKQLFLIFSFKK